MKRNKCHILPLLSHLISKKYQDYSILYNLQRKCTISCHLLWFVASMMYLSSPAKWAQSSRAASSFHWANSCGSTPRSYPPDFGDVFDPKLQPLHRTFRSCSVCSCGNWPDNLLAYASHLLNSRTVVFKESNDWLRFDHSKSMAVIQNQLDIPQSVHRYVPLQLLV